MSIGQQGKLVYPRDLNEYVTPPTYTIEEGIRYNEEAYYDHPDFGKLTFSAPYGKRVVEDLSKRKADERYYIDLDDPLFFYIEKAAKPINMWNGEDWIAIDPSLHLIENGVYRSGPQPVLTELNTNDQKTRMFYENNSISFNNYILKVENTDGTVDFHSANWDNIHQTNFETYISDIFPGIDAKIEFYQGAVKSSFILNQNPNVKSLTFIDNVELSSDLELFVDENDSIGQHFIEIYNTTTSETDILISPAVVYDNSGSKNSWIADYQTNEDEIRIICPDSMLNDPSMEYPITIDPTFTAVGPVASGFGVMGSLLAPASCGSNLVVNFPGGSTPWDTQLTWTVFSDFCYEFFFDFGIFVDCWMSEAQAWVTSSCGGSSPLGAPGTVWTCPGCDNIGTWNPTIGFNQSGTQSLVQCYSPSCANQNLSFTMNLNRTFCASAYGADDCVWANSFCQSLDQWSVTVQGRSVETLGNTITGNGSQNIYDADCAGTQLLDPTPEYGVGPYTYNWSTGGSGATETVPGTIGTYTVDVTDACGTTVTATFDIGCPLEVNLLDFHASKVGNGIALDWTLDHEIGLKAYAVEKSLDGFSWQTIGTVNANGKEDEVQHSLMDNDPQPGKNYYRLVLINESNEKQRSEKISLSYSPAFSVFPNPAEGNINFVLMDGNVANKEVIIYDLFGRQVFNSTVTSNKVNFDLSHLSAGHYVIKLYDKGHLIETNRITLK